MQELWEEHSRLCCSRKGEKGIDRMTAETQQGQGLIHQFVLTKLDDKRHGSKKGKTVTCRTKHHGRSCPVAAREAVLPSSGKIRMKNRQGVLAANRKDKQYLLQGITRPEAPAQQVTPTKERKW